MRIHTHIGKLSADTIQVIGNDSKNWRNYRKHVYIIVLLCSLFSNSAPSSLQVFSTKSVVMQDETYSMPVYVLTLYVSCLQFTAADSVQEVFRSVSICESIGNTIVAVFTISK